MFIGIDVGGTFTDGIVLKDGSILKRTKKPVEIGKVQKSLLEALDDLLDGLNPKEITRVVLSTTVITNFLATNKEDKVAVILVPGTGLPKEFFKLTSHTYFVKGWIDFRGRIIEEIDEEEIYSTSKDIQIMGIDKIAVVCKFSNRNPILEKRIKDLIYKTNPKAQVFLGSEIAGRLNFPRRIVTTYYTAMTNTVWNEFADDIEEAFKIRGINADIEILKADGGTMPLHISRKNPCETIFSGPAASTMGAVALTMTNKNAVVVDIGGTTTDISLLIDGVPLYASKGAQIKGRFSHINSFAVRSIALGGDTAININNDKITIGPERLGPAACFGGPCVTPTDVFNYIFNLEIGNPPLSSQKLEHTAKQAQMNPKEFAAKALDIIVNTIIKNIEDMFKEWENEPAYKVWEVVNRRKFKPEVLIGIGAAARCILPLVAEKMNLEYVIDEYSPVANALGACTARPTIELNLHFDTHTGRFSIEQIGVEGEIQNPENFTIEDAKDFAKQSLKEVTIEKGIDKYTKNAEIFLMEQFNMIRGWDRIGKIFEVGIQIVPGLIEEYKGVK